MGDRVVEILASNSHMFTIFSLFWATRGIMRLLWNKFLVLGAIVICPGIKWGLFSNNWEVLHVWLAAKGVPLLDQDLDLYLV